MKAISRIAVVACLVSAFATAAFANALPENKPGAGDLSPVFTTNDIDGKKVSLEEILKSGKIVFLNFWGLRCSSCIEEIAYLNPLFEKYGPQGVVFIGVNVDGVKADAITRQMPNLPNPPKYIVLPDPEFKIPDMFNLSGAPLSFVIGKDGKVKYRHEDFKEGDEKELETAIQKALAGN